MSVYDEDGVIDLDLLSPEAADALVEEAIAEFIEATDESIDPDVFKAFFTAPGVDYDYDEALEIYDRYEAQATENEVETEPAPAEVDPFDRFVEDHPEAAADPEFHAMLEQADDNLEVALPIYTKWTEAKDAAVEKLAPRKVSMKSAIDEAYEEGLIGPGGYQAYKSERHKNDDALTTALNDVLDAKGVENATRKTAEAVVRRSVDG